MGAADRCGAQKAAHIRKGADAKYCSADCGAAGPVGGFFINAGGEGYSLCIFQRGNGLCAFAAYAREAQSGEIVGNAVKFKGVERAGVDHAVTALKRWGCTQKNALARGAVIKVVNRLELRRTQAHCRPAGASNHAARGRAAPGA